MNSLFEQIQQKIAEIQEITRVADQLSNVMSDAASKTEDFDTAIQQGIKTLEEIEKRSNINGH